MAVHSPHNSQVQFQFNPSTPPPPPPKPSNHSSGVSTPLGGPPRPPPPPPLSGGAARPEEPHSFSPINRNITQPRIEPPADGWVPEILKDKTTVDLHAILSRPDLQQALIHFPVSAHPSLPASTGYLQSLLATNTNLANSLITLEQQMQAARETTQSRLLSLRALEQQFYSKQREQDATLRDFSHPALYQRLSAGVSEQEQLCKGLEESFLEGDGGLAPEREVAEFVKRLREARKTAYLRRERRERWDEGRIGGWR